MKRILPLSLALVLALSLLTACNKDEPAKTTGADTGTVTTAPSPTPAPQNTASPTEYKKGTLTETGFESEYLNLRFSLPETSVMATEADINTMMGLGAEFSGLNQQMIEYANLTTVYEMMATDVVTGSNVIVLVEKLSMSNLTVDQYFSALKTQLQGLGTIAYEVSDDIVTVEVAGQSYQQLTASTSSYGMTMEQTYIIRKVDDRMVGFIFTNTTDTSDAIDTLMAGFTTY